MKISSEFLPCALSVLAEQAKPCKPPAKYVLNLMALFFAFAQMARAADWFVATNGTGGGTSWADATNSIQGAINASSAGDTVWVSNGVYEAGGVTNYPSGGLLTNRVAIDKAITVRSANNDPTNTIIKGAWDPATNGPAAVRCVYMANGSSLIGFMLTNGATLTTGIIDDKYAGGIHAQLTSTVISNCVLTGNSADIYGGGAMYGNLFNCTIVNNLARNGAGGVYNGTLSNCTLTSNSAASYGGGVMYGTLYNCTLTGNSAYYAGGEYGATLSNCTLTGNSAGLAGGGAYYNTTLYNCTLTGNSATSWGGGVYQSTLYNCTLTSNSAPSGAGASDSTLYNCTLTGNSAASYGGGADYANLYNCTLVGNSAGNNGGGASRGILINSIVYFNSAGTSASNWLDVVAFTNTCTTPAATNGPGNITNDPLFIANGSGYGTNHVAGNYRLQGASPCLNAGTNFAWMTDPNDVRSRDLDGQPRIRDGIVDMGAYETLLAGTIFYIH